MPIENEAPPPSMADSINAAIETVEQAPAPITPTQETTTPAETTSTPAPAEGRDRFGKFTPKKTNDEAPTSAPASSSEPAAKATSATAVPAPGAVPAAANPPAADAANAAPQSWTGEAKAKWDALDPQVKGEIQRREREISVGLQRAAETRRFGDSVMQEFAPYAEILSKEGATPQAAIRALLETSYTLRFGSQQHKQALFLSLAQQYGIDLTQQVDPAKARLEWELDSRKHGDLRNEAQQREAVQRDVQQELEAFVAVPGHEHYASVRTVMAGLMGAGTATTLQDAYDQACWANPTIRASLQQSADLARVAAQGKNRNALGTVTGAPGAVNGGAPAVDVKNLRATIESQFGGGRV